MNFLEVIAKFDSNGNIFPISINWQGRIIAIDKILDCRPAPSLKHGGQGNRYTCRIDNKIFYLFNDNNHWFIENIR